MKDLSFGLTFPSYVRKNVLFSLSKYGIDNYSIHYTERGRIFSDLISQPSYDSYNIYFRATVSQGTLFQMDLLRIPHLWITFIGNRKQNFILNESGFDGDFSAKVGEYPYSKFADISRDGIVCVSYNSLFGFVISFNEEITGNDRNEILKGSASYLNSSSNFVPISLNFEIPLTSDYPYPQKANI